MGNLAAYANLPVTIDLHGHYNDKKQFTSLQRVNMHHCLFSWPTAGKYCLKLYKPSLLYQ